MLTLAQKTWRIVPGHRFEEEWERFKARSQGALQGCWTGVWISLENRRQRPVRCVITRIAPGTYIANFRTKLFDLLPVTREVQLSVNESGVEFEMEGTADFGLLLHGVHHFKGSAQPGAIHLVYDSKNDHGEFRLVRGREDGKDRRPPKN